MLSPIRWNSSGDLILLCPPGHLIRKQVRVPPSASTSAPGWRRNKGERLCDPDQSSDLRLHPDRQCAIGDCKQMLKSQPVRIGLSKLKECARLTGSSLVCPVVEIDDRTIDESIR